MFHFTCKIALMLAVVASQVLGGVSCCCLGRTLAAICASTPLEGSTQDSGAACPRCTAKKSASQNKPVQRLHGKSGCASSLVEGGCNCNRAEAQTGLESRSKWNSEPSSSSNHAWLSIVPAVDLKNTNQILVDRFGVPLPHGGRSWQSIACVWRT